MKKMLFILPMLLCMSITAQTKKPCICVLDFEMPDTLAQERFLNFESKPIRLDSGCTLNSNDRVSMNSVMQGYVRMIDAQDSSKTKDANRFMLLKDNEFNRQKALNLYNTVAKGEARPMLLGAEYLTAAIGQNPRVFTVLDKNLLVNAMVRLQQEPDFPTDFMLRLAQKTGATHLICGSIADLHSKIRSYKGYGIETKSIIYELDVLIRVADLPAQKIIYSKVYTGTLKERDTGTGGHEFDGNKYQTLMKSAMEQAGEDLCKQFKETFQVTPIPDGEPEKVLPAKTEPEKQKEESAAVIPARKNEMVILTNTVSSGAAVPPPPAVTPVAADSGAVIVVPAASNGTVLTIQTEKENKK